MPKYPKNHTDVKYYVPGRKRPITGSTKAVSDFLAIVHEANPAATIEQLRDIISDRQNYIPNYEAIAVLDAHISAGHGAGVPNWR